MDGDTANVVLPAGVPLRVFENRTAGWELEQISCNGGTVEDIVDGSKTGIRITLNPNDDVKCTFRNRIATTDVTVSDAQVNEGDSGTTTLDFTVTRSNNEDEVTVLASTLSGTAVEVSDYVPLLDLPVSFEANGPFTQTVSVTINGDEVVEANETLSLILHHPQQATIADGEGQGTILNDDKATLKLSGGTSRTETDSGQVEYIFYALLYDAVQDGFTLDYVNKDLTATVIDGDYKPVSGTLTFAGHKNERHEIVVLVNGDHKVEPDETFGLQIPSGPHTALAEEILVTTEVGRFDLDYHTATIFNDDTAQVTLSGPSSTLEGDSGNTYVAFVAELDHPVAGGFELPFETANNSALNTSDFVDNDQTLTFAGHASEAHSVTVRVLGDELFEPDETFMIELGAFADTELGDNLSVGGSPITVTIINDDAPPQVTVSSVTLVEPESGEAIMRFKVILSEPAAIDISVDYMTVNDTAEAGLDYIATSGTLLIEAGTLEGTIEVTILADTANEGDETFTLILLNPVASELDPTAATGVAGVIENARTLIYLPIINR